MENAEFREARELQLTSRVSRVEMDKWGKSMREETAMTLVEARKAFEKRRDQGRMSTNPVAPAFSARWWFLSVFLMEIFFALHCHWNVRSCMVVRGLISLFMTVPALMKSLQIQQIILFLNFQICRCSPYRTGCAAFNISCLDVIHSRHKEVYRNGSVVTDSITKAEVAHIFGPRARSSLSARLDAEAAAFRARAKKNKEMNGGKTSTRPDESSSLARLSQPSRHSMHALAALTALPPPSSTSSSSSSTGAAAGVGGSRSSSSAVAFSGSGGLSAGSGSRGNRNLQAEDEAARQKHMRISTALALAAARVEYEKRQANANKHSNSAGGGDGKVTTIPRAPRCASLPPSHLPPGAGVSLDGPGGGKNSSNSSHSHKAGADLVNAHSEGRGVSVGQSRFRSAGSDLNSRAHEDYLARVARDQARAKAKEAAIAAAAAAAAANGGSKRRQQQQ